MVSTGLGFNARHSGVIVPLPTTGRTESCAFKTCLLRRARLSRYYFPLSHHNLIWTYRRTALTKVRVSGGKRLGECLRTQFLAVLVR